MRDFNRDWALRLGEVGVSIFPCGEDKKPLVKWRGSSSSNVDQIAQFWNDFRKPYQQLISKNATSLFDGDRHGGPDGRAALRDSL